jgi:hypothetical protein
VGTIAGQNSGTIANALGVAFIGGTAHIGGLVGENTGTIRNSFWDTDVTGQTNATGINLGILNHATGGCYSGVCTNGGTADLSLLNTYESAADGGSGLVTSSWDFNNLWAILPGNETYGFSYPYLEGQFGSLLPPRIFAGFTDPATPNQVVVQANGLFNNGLYSWTNIAYTVTGADGSFYIMNPFGNISD